MTRIYLDSNIYRYLKKSQDNSLNQIKSFLKEDHIHVFYSPAHLFDLGRDKTDWKYKDLLFMEQFTKRNYIELNKENEYVNTTLATPLEAFDSITANPFESTVYSEALDILDGKIDDPKVKELMDSTLNVPIGKNFFAFQDFDEDTKESLKHYLPSLTEESTVKDLVVGMLEKFKGFYSDPKLWQKAIKSSQKGLNLKQDYKIDLNTINFDKKLENTPLATSFVDFVKKIESIQNPESHQKEYGFHIAAYNALNILGLDNERKINFASSLDDAGHSFYAAHCDYFVVNDQQLRMKAKVLYKLLGIETKVLSLEEFGSEIARLKLSDRDLNYQNFLQNLLYELKNSLILDTPSSFVYPRNYVKYKPIAPFFQYFNRMDKIKDDKDGEFIVLYKEFNTYSRFFSYKEFEVLTNLIMEVFGVDDEMRGDYSTKDEAELKEGNWKGRKWTIDKVIYILEINEGTKIISLLIYPTKNNLVTN